MRASEAAGAAPNPPIQPETSGGNILAAVRETEQEVGRAMEDRAERLELEHHLPGVKDGRNLFLRSPGPPDSGRQTALLLPGCRRRARSPRTRLRLQIFSHRL